MRRVSRTAAAVKTAIMESVTAELSQNILSALTGLHSSKTLAVLRERLTVRRHALLHHMYAFSNPERFVRRVFVVNEAGTVRRISPARYKRLRRFDLGTSFPEFAGKAVRVAVIDVGWYRGRPTEIYCRDCELVYFDRLGRLDGKREAERERLVDRLVRAASARFARGNTEAFDHPAKKTLIERYLWEPDTRLDQQLRRLALLRGRPQRARKAGDA